MGKVQDKIDELVEGYKDMRWLDACELRTYLETIAKEQESADNEKIKKIQKGYINPKDKEKLIELLYEFYEADKNTDDYSEQMVKYVIFSVKLFKNELKEYRKSLNK